MNERYRRGREVLDRLDPELGPRILAAYEDIAPDFGPMLAEFAFGEVLARPGLDLRTREIATVAALAALGTAPAQLRAHMRAALNLGWTREELVELMMQMAVYAGFPAALNGLAAAKEVFASRA
jgi:4-carboxymuconolactone decarboxylase